MNLTTYRGNVYGFEYHVVGIGHPEHEGIINLIEVLDEEERRWNHMVEWCVNTFGPVNIDVSRPGIILPNQRWYTNNAKIWFRDKKDLTWFILRWANEYS
jgi:hypothetical protein